jgi:hypothetical protein
MNGKQHTAGHSDITSKQHSAMNGKQHTAGHNDITSEQHTERDQVRKAHVTDVDPLILPAHKILPFIDRRANFHSTNNMNTSRTVTAIQAMKNTEFAMIQIFTNSGFSWGQRENAVVSAALCQRK